MSEIDFAEIEKAMAELVNKAQGKERQQGLSMVSKERSEKAKQVEVAQEQGDIATKRIIVASNSMRSDPHPHPRPQPIPVIPPSPGRVMDFRVPPPRQVDTSEVEKITQEEDEDLNKTVGELSNEYLMEKVSEPAIDDREVDVRAEDKDSYHDQEELGEAEGTSEDPLEKDHVTHMEEIAGPAPTMSVIQEPSMSGSVLPQKDTKPKKDTLPEADELSEDIGKVHKIYGQRLPKEYIVSQKKSQDVSSNAKSKIRKPKSKKGPAFYFVLLMTVLAVAVWVGAAYLYFVS